MKHISALIIPETEPSPHTMAELLIFFDSLSYYLPTESDMTNKYISFFGNLCSSYVPAPLAEEELYRFNRLLREMETSRPDELSRLFSTTTAPLATGQVRDLDETSSAGVYSSLQKNPETKTTIRYKERLWQARLVLKLAEMLDRREAEVRQGLAQVSSAEQKVFAALEGHDAAESENLAEMYGPNKSKYPMTEGVLPSEPSIGTSGLLTTLRLKAWAELYLADSSEQQPLVLATANPDCSSSLLEGYEKIRRRDPVKLFSLPVPALQFTDNEEAGAIYRANRKIFSEAAHKSIEYLGGYLNETATASEMEADSQEKLPTLDENLLGWEKNLQRFFPAPGKIYKLDFYSFPGTSFTGLFQHLFRIDSPVPNNKPKKQTGILAVLTS